MRNSVAKAIKNRVYGTFGKLGRDYQARTYENWIWVIFKDGADNVEIKRFPKLNKKDTNLKTAKDMMESFCTVLHAWNPIQIRDMGPRAIYKLAKTYYKRGQYEEMEALFK